MTLTSELGESWQLALIHTGLPSPLKVLPPTYKGKEVFEISGLWGDGAPAPQKGQSTHSQTQKPQGTAGSVRKREKSPIQLLSHFSNTSNVNFTWKNLNLQNGSIIRHRSIHLQSPFRGVGSIAAYEMILFITTHYAHTFQKCR